MTLIVFRATYPEFKQTGDADVQIKLAEAARRISSDAFGDRYDDAHGLMAAHLLWISPFGATMRLDGDAGGSRYAAEFAELRSETVTSILAV